LSAVALVWLERFGDRGLPNIFVSGAAKI